MRWARESPVGVLGGGSFGRAIAKTSARIGRHVVLWSRSRTVDDPNVTMASAMKELAACEPIFIAVPSGHVASAARLIGAEIDGRHLLVHVSRGLYGDELEPITHILRRETPARRVGALAGPLVADALAEGRPAGGIVGTRFGEVAQAVRDAIAGPTLRVYETTDVIGVELASAMVGVLSLAGGFVQGLGMGPSALSVMVARGLSEWTRLGKTMGADERTFSGLAGIGDLVAAVAGDDRPEIRLGRALARGASLLQAGREAGAHIEAITVARSVRAHGLRAGIATPVSAAIADVIDGKATPDEAVRTLMAGEPTME